MQLIIVVDIDLSTKEDPEEVATALLYDGMKCDGTTLNSYGDVRPKLLAARWDKLDRIAEQTDPDDEASGWDDGRS